MLLRDLIEWLYIRQPGNLVFYDSLTQLLNRNWWEMYAKTKLNNKELYLTLIDLDNLKKVNDSCGHLEGDNLIICFSEILRYYFPEAKLIRLGGDEFLIISEENPLQTIFLLQEKEIFNFSFGVSNKKAGMSLSDALKNADLRMYQQKNQKKACQENHGVSPSG